METEVISNDAAIAEEPAAPAEEAPIEEAPKGEEAAEAPAAEAALYDLPDGRKVPAEELGNEYRSLLSDYTRKSQELASIRSGGKQITNEAKEAPSYSDPEWVPKTYGEIVAAAKEELKRDLESDRQAEESFRGAIASQVDGELAEIMAKDPKVNQDQLFAHATKYSFSSLRAAHQNMADRNAELSAIREQTAKAVKARNADPVATGAGVVAEDDGMDTYDPGARRTSLADHLRALKAKS